MDNANIVSFNGPDQTYVANFNSSITIQNIGDTTWTANGSYRLGSKDPQDNTFWGTNRLLMPITVYPGQEFILSSSITAPDNFGIHSFSWQMVHDGVAWFGNVLPASITIIPYVILPPPTSDPNDELAVAIFNTGPYIMDGAVKRAYWCNSTGRDLKIVKSYLWTGVDTDGVGDCHVQINRVSDYNLVHMFQWDHYANPTAPHNSLLYHDYIRLNNGDSLELTYVANPADMSLQHRAHNVGIIWVKYI